MLHEAGGNWLSLATTHCSRRRPPVYGYARIANGVANGVANGGVEDGLQFTRLSKGTSIDQVLAAWAADED